MSRKFLSDDTCLIKIVLKGCCKTFQKHQPKLVRNEEKYYDNKLPISRVVGVKKYTSLF